MSLEFYISGTRTIAARCFVPIRLERAALSLATALRIPEDTCRGSGGDVMQRSLTYRLSISEIVAKIWQAANHPEVWDDVMAGVTRIMPDCMGGMLFTPFQQGVGFIHRTVGAPDGLVENYRQNWSDKDVLLHGMMRHLPVERLVYSSDDLVPHSVLLKHPVWTDFYAPYGVQESIGAIVCATGAEMTALAFYSPALKQAEIDRRKAILGELVPHVHGAMAAYWRRLRAEEHIAVSKYALDELSLGILWLDQNGKILHANRNAEKILNAHDGLSQRNGEFRATDPDDMAHLSRAMASPAGSMAAFPADVLLRISRPSGRDPYTVSLVPTTTERADAASSTIHFIAYLTDPSDLPNKAGDRLSQLYRLTSAEMAIAIGLARGQTIEELATARNTSIHTVRTQTKQMMSKLGAKRQGDVIRAVVSLSILG